jgi:DNA adenine methylase
MIDCRPALEVIADWGKPGDLIYADPPYVRSTLQLGHNGTKNRSNERPRYYAHEMTDAEHAELLDALDRHPGPVLLSGYRCPLYDERLPHWQRFDTEVRAYRAAIRTESLWLNPVAVGRRRDLFTLSGVDVAVPA